VGDRVCVLALLIDSNPLFPLSWFAEAYTGTSAIFIYEFDAGLLEGPSNNLKCRGARLTTFGLELMHGYDTHACLFCKIELAPRK
jgi:hypothetical protein